MATATATVTISRTSSADAKSLVPLSATAANEGGFRYLQDTNLQQHPTATGFGQSGQTHSVSEDNRHDRSSSESTVAITAHQPATLAPSANLGPCSRPTQMPPRPKPGRKPLPQEDAQDRRRVQNRLAQRNFRDKRAQKVSELTQDNEKIRREADQRERLLNNQLQDKTDSLAKLTLDLEKLKGEHEKLKGELQAANNRADEAERKSQMVHHSNEVVKSLNFPNATLQNIGTSTSLPPMMANWNGPVADHARASHGVIPTPPEDGQNNNWTENETDMTNFFSGRKANNAAQSNDNGSQWLSSNMDVDPDKVNCGFCTDASNCACMLSENTQIQPESQSQPQSQSEPMQIQPGGCDACIRDPDRAAACRALAEGTDYGQRSTQTATNNVTVDQRNDSMALPPMRISCSSAVDRLGPRVPSIAELFPGKIHSYPPGTSGLGFDVAEQEVAQVLHNMSRRNTTAGPSS
jgi:hypothetical protein